MAEILFLKKSERMDTSIQRSPFSRFVLYCAIMEGRMETRKGKKRRPSLWDFFMNLSGPMSLINKISLLLRNNIIKLKNRQDCCGHPGEPGC